jgi:hypothetical protein
MKEITMTKQMTLEQRIGTVLTNDNSKSSVIAAVIDETVAAIVDADEDIKLEQKKAFESLASPNPKAAREAMQAAEFVQTWLRTALLRLQRRLRETQEREGRAQWYAEYEALKAKRDALAAEFREVYPEFEAKVVSLLSRMASNDAEISNLHFRRQSGVKLHLLETELVARGLERFTRDVPSIAKELKLPAFHPGEPPAWPRRVQSHLTVFAPTPYDPRFSDHWWEAREQQRLAQERQPAAINLSPATGTMITASPLAAPRAGSTRVGSSPKAPRSMRRRKPKPRQSAPALAGFIPHPDHKPTQTGTIPSNVVASPGSPTAMPDPEAMADSAPPVTSSEFALATATGGPCGAEANANTASSTSGVVGPEYLSGEGDGNAVADNPTDDEKNEADRR